MVLLREHRGPLRADLRREYGLDVDEALERRTIRPTVLLDLVDNLSADASLWRSIDPDVVWGLGEMLTASLIDEIRVLRWEFERIHFKGKRPPPDPVPRPGAGGNPDVDREVIGRGEGFDSIAEFEAWYQTRQRPAREADARGRRLPARDARGRFVST